MSLKPKCFESGDGMSNRYLRLLQFPPADPCSTRNCNSGECFNVEQVTFCVCPEGTSGENCELGELTVFRDICHLFQIVVSFFLFYVSYMLHVLHHLQVS